MSLISRSGPKSRSSTALKLFSGSMALNPELRLKWQPTQEARTFISLDGKHWQAWNRKLEIPKYPGKGRNTLLWPQTEVDHDQIKIISKIIQLILHFGINLPLKSNFREALWVFCLKIWQTLITLAVHTKNERDLWTLRHSYMFTMTYSKLRSKDRDCRAKATFEVRSQRKVGFRLFLVRSPAAAENQREILHVHVGKSPPELWPVNSCTAPVQSGLW